MRVTDQGVGPDRLVSISCRLNRLAVSTFPASVTTVTCLPAWGCAVIAAPLLLPAVARLFDCLQLFGLWFQTLKKEKRKKNWPSSPCSLFSQLCSRPGSVFSPISVPLLPRSLGVCLCTRMCACVCVRRYLPHYVNCFFVFLFYF